jgi:putative transposase
LQEIRGVKVDHSTIQNCFFKFSPELEKEGNTVDFLLTKCRQKMSAHRFFNKAIGNNEDPRVVNIDKSGSNKSVLQSVNKRSLRFKKIKIRQCKYLNNIVEQDHLRVKRRIVNYTGFKEFESAQRTLAGIEVVTVIIKN